MATTNDFDPILFQKLTEEFVPELLAAGEEALAVYEQGRMPDGEQNFSNYILGCAFWESSFNRIRRVCLTPDSFFNCVVYSNILEVSATINSKKFMFFISRVDRNSRKPKSGKGIKKLLQSQIIQGQGFLSEEIKKIASQQGVYTIGVDLDAENGIGKITFDLLVPGKPKTCEALTCATLYDSESYSETQVVPETIKKVTLQRKPSRHLAKTRPRDMKAVPEQVAKKQPSRERQDLASARKAKNSPYK